MNFTLPRGFFDKKDHFNEWNVKKDHLPKKLSKRTTYTVAAGVPGDTCRLPPLGKAAAHAATGYGGRFQIFAAT